MNLWVVCVVEVSSGSLDNSIASWKDNRFHSFGVAIEIQISLIESHRIGTNNPSSTCVRSAVYFGLLVCAPFNCQCYLTADDAEVHWPTDGNPLPRIILLTVNRRKVTTSILSL